MACLIVRQLHEIGNSLGVKVRVCRHEYLDVDVGRIFHCFKVMAITLNIHPR